MPLRRQAMTADVFLTGSNAVTLDGKLVNVDATGNRVAAMIFGPKKTIVVAGVNKIVHTVGEALDRITANWAAPQNARRLQYDTPCATTGVCNDCRTAGRICKGHGDPAPQNQRPRPERDPCGRGAGALIPSRSET